MEKRGYTHSKFILGVHSTPAHRPGVMKLMHVVGFVKAERQEIIEAPGTRPVLARVVSMTVAIRLLTLQVIGRQVPLWLQVYNELLI